jgi:hypothetical protein
MSNSSLPSPRLDAVHRQIGGQVFLLATHRTARFLTQAHEIMTRVLQGRPVEKRCEAFIRTLLHGPEQLDPEL